MVYVVYCLTCRVNGKVYVGVTTDLEVRLKQHCRETSRCYAIASAIRKHGWDKFSVSVLQICAVAAEAAKAEREWISALNSLSPAGYNIKNGGYRDAPSDEKTLRICCSCGRRFAGYKSPRCRPCSLRPFWDDQRRARLARLFADTEIRVSDMAQQLGCGIGVVEDEARRLGLRRQGTSGRYWSDADKQTLRDLWHDLSLSLRDIADRLCRTVGSIEHEASKLDLPRLRVPPKVRQACSTCGLEYERPPSQAGPFCSMKCMGSARRKPHGVFSCEICGAGFTRKERTRNYRFCSRACQNEGIVASAPKHELFGNMVTTAQLTELTGMSHSGITNRIRLGWSTIRIVSTPAGTSGKSKWKSKSVSATALPSAPTEQSAS